MRNFKITVLLSLFCWLSVVAQKEAFLPSEENGVVSDSILKIYSADPEFQYVIPRQFSPNKSWMEKLRSWKNELIRKFQQMQNSRTFNIVLIVLGFVTLAYFFTNLGFRKKKKNALGDEYNEWENLYQKVTVEDTFLQELRLMEEKLAYREAIRWMFLRYLAVLESKGYIQWQSGKTNMDYYREIKNSGLETDYFAFMKAYNVSWFGYHELNQEEYAINKNLIMNAVQAMVPKNVRHEVE
ncbi:MAG: hypothetical protein IPN73_13730 [Saprospiraceae bacterium]|nr:hypothetical protein [Saprospiraceae bacterium]MBK8851200.1 hypothetical protein [Saprospiraceae bacterium]